MRLHARGPHHQDVAGLVARQDRHQRLVGPQQRLDLGGRQRALGRQLRVARELGLQPALQHLDLLLGLAELTLEVVVLGLALVGRLHRLLGQRGARRGATPPGVLQVAAERGELGIATPDPGRHRAQRLGGLVAARDLDRGEHLGGQRRPLGRALGGGPDQRVEIGQHARQPRALERRPVLHLQLGRPPEVAERALQIAGGLLVDREQRPRPRSSAAPPRRTAARAGPAPARTRAARRRTAPARDRWCRAACTSRPPTTAATGDRCRAGSPCGSPRPPAAPPRPGAC